MTVENRIEVEGSDLQEHNFVILVDFSSKIDKIKEIKSQGKSVIISFDYESHKMLSDNGIEHEISDNYLNETDLQLIQKNSYRFSKWFKQPKISSMMEYHRVNLGQLLEVEFSSFLIKFLKQFLELTRILKKYHDAKFVSSLTLYDIIKPMTDNVTSYDIKANTKLFFYDHVKYSFKIGSHSYVVSIPRHYYIKLKKILDKILQFLFRCNTKPSNSKSALLVEFDTIRFRSLFDNMNKYPLNFVLYNRRRPPIWNFESFKIIKNSKCKIASNHSLDGEINYKIKQGLVLAHSKINSILREEEFLVNFFSIYEISFWFSMKSSFVELFNKRIEEFVTEIETARQLLLKQRFSCIVIWSEVGLTEKIILRLAEENSIPIVLIQHGIFYDTKEAYDMNKSQGAFPKDVEKYVVWGELEAENAKKYDVKPEKIEILGAPQYDNTIDSKNNNLKRDFILVATSGFIKEEVYGLTVKTALQYEKIISKICKIASTMNKKLIIKLHPALEEPADFSALTKKINPDVVVLRAGSITPFLQSCDVLIMIDLTSVVLEAQLYKKPVISIPLQTWWGIPKIFSSDFCTSSDIDDLEDVLNKILKNDDFRNQLIEKGTAFVNRYLSNIGTASIKILDLINRIAGDQSQEEIL